ncbi:MAG: hypothetical protein KC983_03930 [Phycisphaerales bacterium]|nr:hypothetical protein [Phycisphaerales bacterium]
MTTSRIDRFHGFVRRLAGLDRPAGAARVAGPAVLIGVVVAMSMTSPTTVAQSTTGDRELIALLEERIAAMSAENNELRNQLAQTQLIADAATRELEQLRQFIVDHHEYGNDFEQYQFFKQQREDELRRVRQEEARTRRLEQKSERDAKRAAAKAERERELAEAERNKRYSAMGFGPIGLGVYTSRMAYAYETNDTERREVRYHPRIGWYEDTVTATEIDFSRMTISGSVLNSSDEVRNIGVAITFFDEFGNQVGHEMVQIRNARTDVPYPFTSVIDMALNREFDSVSTYVLYADVATDEPAAAPAP